MAHSNMCTAPGGDADPSNRLVWVDCEMTGLDPDKDHILEIAVLITDGQLNLVAEGPDLIIHQPEDVLANMNQWCVRQHGDSGLTKAVRESRLGLTHCEDLILEFVTALTPRGKCPLAGNSVGQDAKFLSRYMPRLMDHLHYRVVDVSTIKELVRRWYPQVLDHAPRKRVTHRALGDIRESVEELKFYRESVFITTKKPS